jgi:hypothetical protein
LQIAIAVSGSLLRLYRQQTPSRAERAGGEVPMVALATDARLQEMAAVIHGVIPGSEARLYSWGEACGYGSRARGTAGPESDIDLSHPRRSRDNQLLPLQ